MKKKLLLALTLGSAALAGTPSFAFAQAAPPAAAAPHERMRDRTVTREEALTRADRMFDAIDTNHDGKITPDERKAAHEKMRERWQARHAEQTAPGADANATPDHKWGGGHRGGHHMGMRGMRGDPNRVITREEWHEKAAERFDRMDLNHDGQITPDERKAAREQMREKFRERMQMRRDRGDTPGPGPAPAPTPNAR
ncbi:EF-hand domain-containing protein [Sphingomonas sp. 66-10]|nr:EF-hand domain-containing protein [Sphingomonas sp. 66-10]